MTMHQQEIPRLGTWRAEIQLGNAAVPFHIEICTSDIGFHAYYLNGPERMRVEELRLTMKGGIELNFPSYSACIRASFDDIQMNGKAIFNRPSGAAEFPFQARHGEQHRFFKAAEAKELPQGIDISGTWQALVDYAGDGTEQAYTLRISQQGRYIQANFASAYGDTRFLQGELRGKELFLSIFDGGLIQYWCGQLDEEGALSGHTTNTTFQQASWNATRCRQDNRKWTDKAVGEAGSNVEHDLGEGFAIALAQPLDNSKPLQFQLPGLTKHDRVSLSEDLFQDKVVAVILSASWCPTCHDQADFFVDFYHRRRSQGLEAVQVMFEFSSQWQVSIDQILAFKRRYKIPYRMAFGGGHMLDERNQVFPQLKEIRTFPTVILLDRMGRIRHIVMSFSGPATGDAHHSYRKQFTNLVDQLLLEQA